MSPARWPLHSRGLAVHPTQIPEMKRLFPHHNFDERGRMIIRSQKEFDQVRADLGMRDNDGYGAKRVSRDGHRMAAARVEEERVKQAEERARHTESREGQREIAERRARRAEAVEQILERRRQQRRG